VSELKSYDGAGQERATFLIEQQNQFLLLLAYDEYYNPSARVSDEVIPVITDLQHTLINHFATSTEPYKQIVPTELNLALQLWLTFGKPASEEIIEVLEKISPLDSTSKRIFDHYYVKGRYEANGRIPSDYNGGYHTMASLYAAVGNADGIIRCFEMLPESYFRSSLFNNYNNVLGYLYQYNHVDQTSAISKWLVDHFPTDDPLTVYRNTVIRSGYIPGLFGINLLKNYTRSNTGYFHVNLGMSKREQFFAIADEYEKLAKDVKEPNERNYLLAMHYKRVAILYSKYLYDRGLPVDQNQMDEWLDKAWVHFKQVNDEHLAGKVAVNYRYLSDGIRTIQSPRKLVFLYPDYRDGFFAHRYNTDVFVEHAMRKGFLSNFYNTAETIELLHEWISTSTEVFFYMRNDEATGYFNNDFIISDTLLTEIIRFVDSSPAGNSFDKNLPILLLANRSFEKGDTARGVYYFQKLEKEKLLSSGNKYEYVSQTYFINAMIDLTTHLAKTGHFKESMEIISSYMPYQKAFFYSSATNALYNQYKPTAFVFLDSAFATINRVDYNLYNGLFFDEWDARRFTIYVLGKVGGDRVNALSKNYIKELIERSRVRGIRGMILGTATDGNYYTALTTMPPTLTEAEELQCYSSILSQIARSQNNASGWAGMDESLLWEFNYFMGY
jgi:hypothetical protein